MTSAILFGALVAALVSTWATAQPDYTLGEIKSVDLERGAVTVKHAPIRNLGMPDMTMRFRLADPASAKSLRTGDRIRFRVEKRDGTLVITDVARR